jgi:hypothetical protein
MAPRGYEVSPGTGYAGALLNGQFAIFNPQ